MLMTCAPWRRGEPDAARDRRDVALALVVEHPHRHDPRVVGDARDADAVVRRLRDQCRRRTCRGRCGRTGSALPRTKSWPRTKRLRSRSGALQVAAVARVAVGDAGVEHRDDHALAARRAGVDRVLPGVLARRSRTGRRSSTAGWPSRPGPPRPGSFGMKAVARRDVVRHARARRAGSDSQLRRRLVGGPSAARPATRWRPAVDHARPTRTPAARADRVALGAASCRRGTSRPARPATCGARRARRAAASDRERRRQRSATAVTRTARDVDFRRGHDRTLVCSILGDAVRLLQRQADTSIDRDDGHERHSSPTPATAP